MSYVYYNTTGYDLHRMSPRLIVCTGCQHLVEGHGAHHLDKIVLVILTTAFPFAQRFGRVCRFSLLLLVRCLEGFRLMGFTARIGVTAETSESKFGFFLPACKLPCAEHVQVSVMVFSKGEGTCPIITRYNSPVRHLYPHSLLEAREFSLRLPGFDALDIHVPLPSLVDPRWADQTTAKTTRSSC